MRVAGANDVWCFSGSRLQPDEMDHYEKCKKKRTHAEPIAGVKPPTGGIEQASQNESENHHETDWKYVGLVGPGIEGPSAVVPIRIKPTIENQCTPHRMIDKMQQSQATEDINQQN